MKRLIRRTIAIAAIGTIGLLSNPALAQASNLEKAAQILQQQSRSGRGEFITYLTGAATAYRWAGETSKPEATGGLYCPPPDAKLDGRGYANIALAEYKRGKEEYESIRDYPLSVLALALLRGLKEKFPCLAESTLPLPPSQ